jgi:predicted nucleic acid-binding protein
MSKVLLDTNVVLRLLAETDPRHELGSVAVADALRAGHDCPP